jgi:hypothetical protein
MSIRNSQCECGSGKKFKKCCWKKPEPKIEPPAQTKQISEELTDELKAKMLLSSLAIFGDGHLIVK